MTQPSAVNTTFDTSLIDTHQQQQQQHQQVFDRSFSSTETNTSGNSIDNNIRLEPSNTNDQASTMAAAGTQQAGEAFTAVTNAQLYDTWAETYDTDGNVLQAVDDLELDRLLPELERLVCRASDSVGGNIRELRILDFGCGTGRNTVKLLQLPWIDGAGSKMGVEVHGWDASDAMLEIARRKCDAAITSTDQQNVRLAALEQIDFSSPSGISAQHHGSFDAIISTLVLEHLPLRAFFSHLTVCLRPGGYALVTNMHPDMGRSTRAGYKTASGERVKGESWVHGVQESVQAAKEAGLEVVDIGGATSLRERAVREPMIESGVVGARGRKWVGVKVWYGFVVRKGEA